MFKDYYRILEVDFSASAQEIKNAYRKVAIKWHPDKNPDISTVQKMQDINETYQILGNLQKREIYDTEYLKYQDFEKKREKNRQEQEKRKTPSYAEEASYQMDSDILREWMQQASLHAKNMTNVAVDELRGIFKGCLPIILSAIGGVIILYIIIKVIGFIFF